MRQYILQRHLIEFIAVCVCGFALLAGKPALAQPAGTLDWMADASTAYLRAQTEAPVKPFALTLTPNGATADVELESWAKGGLLNFVIAVPPVTVTSATFTLRGADAAHPAPVRTQELGWVRGNKLLRVQFSLSPAAAPDAVPAGGRLEFAFENSSLGTGGASPARPSSAGPGGVIQKMLSRLVANPSDVTAFETKLPLVPPPGVFSAPPLGDATVMARARFDVDGDGFVNFTGKDLAAAGIALENLPRSSVSVWTDGAPQAVWAVASDEDTELVQPDDHFIVYARDDPTSYSAQRSYWISTDQPAMAMKRRTLTSTVQPDPAHYFMATEVIEKDNPPVLTKNDQFLSILDFRWVWWTWRPQGGPADGSVPDPRSYSEPGRIDFDLPALATAAADASSVTLHFYVHQWHPDSQAVPFEVILNGASVGEAVVDSAAGLAQAFTVPSAGLREAGNRLEILPVVTSVTSTTPEICFDRLEMQYPRRYELTSATLPFSSPVSGERVLAMAAPEGSFVADVSGAQPEILAVQAPGATGSLTVPAPPAGTQFELVTAAGVRRVPLQRYEKADDLRAQDNAGDLVVISWPEFLPELDGWLAQKKAEGYTPRVVNVTDVYDQFGFGRQSPHAIRAFLRYAAENWRAGAAGPAVSAIVLVGDSSSDWRGEFRNDVINYVPTMRLGNQGESFASDQWYACLFGDDNYADALVGRFSVNSVEDLRRTLAKQVTYARAPEPGSWQNTLGFIADHSDFEDPVNRVMKRAVPPRFFIDRIMMSELPWVDNFYFPKNVADAQQAKVSTKATSRIRDMFNSGAAVVTYFGHGSPNVWSSERMWFGGDSPNSDNLSLTNRDKLSIVINMTCNSGAIDYPQPRWNVCISEDFMRVENGGAVACFVPSGPGLTVQHERLMMEVAYALFVEQNGTLGADLQLALWRYLAQQNPPDLAQMYILLGDPLLKPQVSRAASELDDAPVPGVSSGFVMLPPQDGAAARAAQVKDEREGVVPEPIQNLAPQSHLLPVTQQPADKENRVLAWAQSAAGTTLTESAFLPLENLNGARVVQWRRLDAGAADAAKARVEIRLQNDSAVPVKDAQVMLAPRENPAAEPSASASQDLRPFAQARFEVECALAPGLNHFDVTLRSGGAVQTLKAEPPVVMARVRPDGEAGRAYPPALIDPASLEVRYRENPEGVRAQISFFVYVLAREALSNLSVGLAGPDGIIEPETIAPVSAVEPGAGTRVHLSAALPAGQTSATYALSFDPSGYYPELRNFPVVPVALGTNLYPDLKILNINSPEPSPTEGETIFFDVTVGNHGKTTVEGVKVDGRRALAGGAMEPLANQINRPQPLVNLPAGSSETVRLRWDPFQNAGHNRIELRATSIYQTPDANDADNQVEITVPVRTKEKLRKGQLSVLPLTAEDRAKSQIRIAAEVANDGQTDAHGLRVRVLDAAKPGAEELLGEADLDEVPAGKSARAVVVYPLKPGEENRKFQMRFEVQKKGSRQRLPLNDGR